jgi:diguanylate cyclase (GGDEF)-like protein
MQADPTTEKQQPPKHQRSLTVNPRQTPLRMLYAGTTFLILILVMTNAAVILHLRESELLSQEGQLKDLSLIMAEQADRTFQAVDLVISSVAEKVSTDSVHGAIPFDQKMSGYDVHLFLQDKISGVPQLDAVSVVSREGKLLNFSRPWPVPARDVTDRAYFKALKADPNLGNYISEPVQNRGSGTWTIFLARRVNGANGEFLGIILGAIEMRYFEDFYRAISHGEGGAITLQRLDGVVLARFPKSDAIGKTFYDSWHLLQGGVSGTLREPSFIDGRMRIKTAHLVSNYPLVALATKTETSALAGWRRVAVLMALGALGCSLSIVVAAFAFGRQWTQRAVLAASRAELLRQEDRATAMTVAMDVAQTVAVKMTYSAEHDFLTGLPNRILLSDRISQAIALARRHHKKVAVLFLDLDGFKHINDSLGHSTGDQLLQSVANHLVACVRASDTVSRQGGDEFVVLLSELEQSEDAAIAARRIARVVAEVHSVDQPDPRVEVAIAAKKMLRAVAETHSIARHELQVTASIGVSVYPDDGLDAETLIQNADTAMYQAKENGPQSYQFFQPAMNVRAVERQFIEESLGQAMERREFVMHYQPVIDLRTGAITGAEALIRWRHPTRGLVLPAQFIAVAEDCGLMLPIGRWVLHQACLQAQTWVDAGLPKMTVAVNVSARQFRDEDFLTNLLATLDETGLDPKYLVLELTESVLMKRAEATASILRVLRGVGAKVAIDDFGTGYSSLSYLRKFPVDILKIDQSFVRQISASDEDRAIVAAVVNMAHSLKLRVIAEGVESLCELEFLQAHQCDEVQGYYFGQPVPAEQFANVLRAGITKPHHVRPGPASFEPQTA